MNLTKDSQAHLNSSKQSSKPQLSGVSSSSPSFLRSKKSLLGTTTGLASAFDDTMTLQTTLSKQVEQITNKYKLQRIAKALHPEHRITACMSAINVQSDNVELHYSSAKNHAHYRNLMRCDDVWKCPVCASRVTSYRADEIRRGYAYAVDVLGYRVVMVTYTMRHNRHDPLQKNIDDLRLARKKMRSGRKWQKFKKDYGYVGAISALEVTYSSDNGWHVHVHEIQFFNPEKSVLDLDVKNVILDKWLDNDLSAWWCDSLKKVGRSATLKTGIDVTSANKYIAEYVSKYGKMPETEKWDIASEVAKSGSKVDASGLHPFGILNNTASPLIEQKERNKFTALWHEYATAFHGEKQLFWTAGLKDLLQIEETKVEDMDNEGKSVYGISRDAWKAIRYMNKRAELLVQTVYSRGDFVAIERFVIEMIHEANKRRKMAGYWQDVELTGKYED